MGAKEQRLGSSFVVLELARTRTSEISYLSVTRHSGEEGVMEESTESSSLRQRDGILSEHDYATESWSWSRRGAMAMDLKSLPRLKDHTFLLGGSGGLHQVRCDSRCLVEVS